MRFFHLSDLHIGRHLHGYSLLEQQKQVLGQVLRWAEEKKPDAIVIAGDIYDKVSPSGGSGAAVRLVSDGTVFAAASDSAAAYQR